ncbi:MAG TPA: zinc ABC transporter substrate-binding protein [Methylomirabilota bacterium]|nr:zinc ABC transporter substrate-binding protein [Methylomirabilota bacterium]
MKKIFLILLIVILALGALVLVSKRNVAPSPKNGKLEVTASFYPLYFFVTQIGGDKVEVKNMTPAAAEPHDYDPTTQDIARIEKSNMLILNGGVEAWGDKIKDNLKGTNVTIVTAGEGLLTRKLIEEDKTAKDPHVWLDPQLAKKEVTKITEGFVKADPTNTSYYQTNEKNLDAKLDQLDTKYKQGLAACQQKDIITSHAAFGYLGQRYGLNQVAIAGLSPDEEPSTQQLTNVASFAKEHNIKYIFFESLVSPKLSDTIATEIGAKTLVLDPLEGISDDDMKQGKNYFTVMENNLKNLQQALACSK